jgi:hypothetical protein
MSEALFASRRPSYSASRRLPGKVGFSAHQRNGRHGGVWENGSLPSPPEHMQRALAGSPLDGRGLLGRVGEWQQATLLHDIREPQEQALISKTRDQLTVYERYEMRGPGPWQKRERPAALAVVLIESTTEGGGAVCLALL